MTKGTQRGTSHCVIELHRLAAQSTTGATRLQNSIRKTMPSLLRLCSFILLTFMSGSAVACDQADRAMLDRFFLPEADYGSIGGRCLDGSMADYYYKAGVSDSTTWIIFLKGGGFCMDKQSCQDRARGGLGSSTKPTSEDDPARGLQGLFCRNEDLNPGFASAHQVWIPYRTGDLHAGNRTTPHEDWGVYFSGHLNLVNIIDHLKKRNSETKILSATQVLITGCSAGGIGTILNAEWLSNTAFPYAMVKAAPISGLFAHNLLLNATYPEFVAGTTHPLPPDARLSAELWEVHAPASCVEAVGNGDPTKQCFFAPTVLEHTPVDVLVVDSQFDQFPLEDQLQFPAEASGSAVGDAFLRLYGDVIRAAHRRLSRVFSTSCFDHCSGISTDGRDTTAITVGDESLSAHAVIRDWFFETNAWEHRVIEARTADGLPGNPTCKTECGAGAISAPPCVSDCLQGCGASAQMTPGSPECLCSVACDMTSCPAEQAQALSAALAQACPAQDAVSVPTCVAPCLQSCGASQAMTAGSEECGCSQSCSTGSCSAQESTFVAAALTQMCGPAPVSGPESKQLVLRASLAGLAAEDFTDAAQAKFREVVASKLNGTTKEQVEITGFAARSTSRRRLLAAILDVDYTVSGFQSDADVSAASATLAAAQNDVLLELQAAPEFAGKLTGVSLSESDAADSSLEDEQADPDSDSDSVASCCVGSRVAAVLLVLGAAWCSDLR